MSEINVYKLFENVMDEKFRSDIVELQLAKQPRTMPEFVMDYFYMRYGLRTLALKQLGSLVQSLERMVLKE
jgi:hypothetical protein